MTPAASLPIERAGTRVEPRAGIAWPVWAMLSALPWLLPLHAPPWPMFWSEALMAALLLPVAAWAVWRAGGRVRIDALTAGCAAVALLPLLQAWAGRLLIPGEAPLASLYLGAFALTLLVARQAQEQAPGRLVDALFAGLAAAALASTGLALYQRLGLDVLGLLVAPSPERDRAVANIGQPNNLATLLLWGLVAVGWGVRRGSIGAAVAWCASAFLLVGVVLCQSRTAWLGLALLACVALFCRPLAGPSRRARLAFVASLALWCLAVVAVASGWGGWAGEGTVRTLDQQVAAGTRPTLWRMALTAIAAEPWAGWGWNQGVTVHVAYAERFPIPEIMQFAHNVVLDLLLWNGVPLGLLILAGLGAWGWRQWRGPQDAERALLLTALALFLLHASLELPHAYLYFLLPAAVMMGTLSAGRPSATLAHAPAALVGAAVAVHGVALAVAAIDYGRIQDDLEAFAFRSARIGRLVVPAAPELRLLGALQAALVQMRTEPARGMAPADLEAMRRTASRYPGHGLLLRYAEAAALNGRPDEARRALGVLCAVYSRTICARADVAWRQGAAAGKPEMAAVEVPVRRAAAARSAPGDANAR